MSNWKQELLALEQEYATHGEDKPDDLDAELVRRKVMAARRGRSKPETTVVKPTPARQPVISRSHAKFIVNVARVLYQHTKQEEAVVQASSISVVDQRPFVIKRRSLEDYIKQALIANQDGVDIYQLIAIIEAAGWASGSKYHRYNLVAKVLRRDYYMFARFQDGDTIKYKLRPAFNPNNTPDDITAPIELHKSETIPSLKDIIVDVMNGHSSYPGQVYGVLQHMNYRTVSYKSVYRAMQDTSRFKRDGNRYVAQ